MRQKLTLPRAADREPAPADDDLIPTSQSPLRWLLANEAGWGVPHGLFGMFAALVAGYASAGMWRWIRAQRRSSQANREPRVPRAR